MHPSEIGFEMESLRGLISLLVIFIRREISLGRIDTNTSKSPMIHFSRIKKPDVWRAIIKYDLNMTCARACEEYDLLRDLSLL